MKLAPIELNELPSDFKLRPGQEEMLFALRKSISDGNKRIIAHGATAFGKTILAGMVFYLTLQKDPEAQCWFVVNRNVLLKQTKAEFERIFGFDCSIVQGSNTPDLTAHIQLATIQTLQKRLDSDKMNVYTAFNNAPAKIVVIDEAHITFKGYKIINERWAPLMIGLTATPFSDGMGNFWQDMCRPKRMRELIADGTISDYKVKACIAIDRSKLTVSSTGEYREADVERESEAIIGDVYREWATSDEVQGKSFLGFATTIATCVALAELFQSNGVNVAYVHSKMSEELVEDTLRAFKAGHYQGVFSVVKLIEGFDFPAASVALDCAPIAPSKTDPNIPNSCNRYVQKAGRVFRAHADKDVAIIHDHAGNFERYGPYELIEELFTHLDSTKEPAIKEMEPKERIERVVRECTNCGMIAKGGVCHICGHEAKEPTHFVQAGDLKFIDGEMVELKKTDVREEPGAAAKRNRTHSWEEKIQFARELKGHCLAKKSASPGMNVSGYYAHKYRARYNVWPNDDRVKYDRVEALQPSEGVISFIKSQNIKFAKLRQGAA